MHEEAEILAVGLRLGLVQQLEVIAWADKQILDQDDPSIELIDLASMREAHALDVLGKLRELSPGRPVLEVLPAVLNRFTERLREDPTLGPSVAKGLWDIAVEANYQVPEELSPIFGFDEDYWLAQSGAYGTDADVYANLLTFCERFEHAV
ncbi:MAG: hypothetical protein OEQ25_08100 [Gammaproteobacteria bacterium]|nr:hypothetical protein [Gammaproteobacteria bacterium]